MLTQTPNQSHTEVWVEVRVDDGSSDRSVSYIGSLRRDLLEAWTRIEQGECWFRLRNVLWYHEEEVVDMPDAASGSLSLFGWFQTNQRASGQTTHAAKRGLMCQAEKARYWGYTNDIYLRLDRVFRIMLLTTDYVETVVLPALERHAQAQPAVPKERFQPALTEVVREGMGEG